MATLKQVRDKADAKLVQFWQLLQQKQAAYFAKHGKYFQLLVSPSETPIEGADSDFIVRKPSDEKFVADVDFPWTDKVPFQIEVHEWVGKDKGYEAVVTVEYKGTKYRRSRDSNQVDSGWYKVTENYHE